MKDFQKKLKKILIGGLVGGLGAVILVGVGVSNSELIKDGLNKQAGELTALFTLGTCKTQSTSKFTKVDCSDGINNEKAPASQAEREAKVQAYRDQKLAEKETRLKVLRDQKMADKEARLKIYRDAKEAKRQARLSP